MAYRLALKVSFTTLPFATLLLVVVTAAWSVRRHRVARNTVLLVASAWFYATWSPRLLVLLWVACVLGFVGGEAVVRARGWRRTAALWATNTAFLCLLGAFKYYDFFRVNLAQVAGALGLSAHLPLLDFVLPAGISFYTFQGMAYVIDLHRGRGHRAKSFLDFALFQSFFPQLVAGPICRSHELLPQIEAGAPEGVPDLSRAVSLLASGVFKKVVVATWLQTHLVDSAFAAPENHSSVELLLALYAYSMQVYADFSGYTDIALGAGLLLGFRLPENFARPYAATSIGEYWRRWHMTFSRWLRDYIYFPLGGSHVPRPRAYFNLFLTFLLGGLWHGARWGFLVWGAIHGIALVVQKATRDLRRDRGGDPDAPWPVPLVFLSWLVTFHVCVFARLFFRAGDLEPAGRYLEGLVALTVRGLGIDPMVVVLCAAVMAMNLFGHRMREGFISLHERVPAFGRPAVWMAVAAAVLALQPGGVPPYIYLRF